MDSNKETLRYQLEQLRVRLSSERSSYDSHWRDLSDYILPRKARFTLSETNRGEIKNQKILDNTATIAARTLRSGQAAGITPTSRPWFRMGSYDPSLSRYRPVKLWSESVAQIMHANFLRSNFYPQAHQSYHSEGVFGTGAVFVEEDFDTVARFYAFPIGSYYVALDGKLRPRVFFREVRMTVRQVMDLWGNDGKGGTDFSRVSSVVKTAWERHHYEQWIDIYHAVIPNPDYNPNMLESRFKRYLSVYYEIGSSDVGRGQHDMMFDSSNDQKVLSRKGYDIFPLLISRWETVGTDPYGTGCPGMDCLGDVKELQFHTKRKAQSVDLVNKPPMKGPATLKNKYASILPGDITYDDEREGMKGFQPVYQIDPRVQELIYNIQDIRGRIHEAFYTDLFKMLIQTDRREITATEIDERREEKLINLGPMLEQKNEDFLDPLIDIFFQYHLRQGRLPEPPEELQGNPLKVEYISNMFMAQRLVGISSIERFTGFVTGLVQGTGNPQDWHIVDRDELILEYGERVGISARITRDVEEANAIRTAEQQAIAQQQQMEQIQQGADALLKGAKAEQAAKA